MPDTRLDVLAIGDAVVDVIATADDAFLAEEGLVKGSMQVLDAAGATRLYAKMSQARETSGGSAGNTAAGVAMLGGRAGFVGQIADDQLGDIFAHDIRALGVEAGIFAFLMLVVTSSAVAELFGRSTANQLVTVGFVPLVFSIVLAMFVLALPAADDMPADRLAAFETVMGGTPRIWAAGIVAYGISQFLNVTIFSALRGKSEGRLIWLRAGIAGVLSQIVDTLLFITISFYGLFPIGDLLLGQRLAKVVLSAVLVPPLVQIAVMVARRVDAPAAAR